MKHFQKHVCSFDQNALDLGLRNDVIDQATNKQTADWKGLRTQDLEAILAGN
jgi:hypothetical protein